MATFCSKCGKQLEDNATVCSACGATVASAQAEAPRQQPVIVNIENSNTNSNTNINPNAMKKEKNKWVALLLLIFLGAVGGHKFYEGKIGMGILYIFTVGFFGIGCIIDFFSLLFKPNPYYV